MFKFYADVYEQIFSELVELLNKRIVKFTLLISIIIIGFLILAVLAITS